MPTEPAAPPEAELLRRARSSQRLSVREAADRAGISENRWRQVEAGYQTVRKGVRVPANATAATLASMARTVNVSPERLESEGERPDAAKILREIIKQQADGRAIAPAQPTPDDDESLAPYLQSVRDDLASAMARYGAGFSGSQAFTLDHEIALWDKAPLSPQQKENVMAITRRLIDKADQAKAERSAS